MFTLHFLTDLYDTALIQLDLPSLGFQVLADIVNHGGGLQHKPTLSPVPTYMPLFPHITLETRGRIEEERKWEERRRQTETLDTKYSPSWGHCDTSPGRPHPTPDWRPRRWWPSGAGLHPCAPGSSIQTCTLPALWHRGILHPPRAFHPIPGSSPWRFSWGDTPPKSIQILLEPLLILADTEYVDILYQCISATYTFTEESYCADSTKAVYFCLCRQETKSIMEEVQEGRHSLTYLLALAFLCCDKM